MPNNTITVPITFTEDDLNSLLVLANNDGDNPLTCSRLKEEGRWEAFISEFIASDMKDEFMEYSDTAIDNGWLDAYAYLGDEFNEVGDE